MSGYSGSGYSGGHAGRVMGRAWGWLVLVGIISLIGGVLALANPFAATITVVQITGAFFLVMGILQIIHAFRMRGWGGFLWSLVLGILTLFIGVALFRNPFGGAVSLTIVVAALLLLMGILKCLFAFQMRPLGGWGWGVLSGAVSILLALAIFAYFPVSALTVLGFFLGVELVSSGIWLIMIGMAARKF